MFNSCDTLQSSCLILYLNTQLFIAQTIVLFDIIKLNNYEKYKCIWETIKCGTICLNVQRMYYTKIV